MKITKAKLKQIIKEELSNVINENTNESFLAVKTPKTPAGEVQKVHKVHRVSKNQIAENWRELSIDELAQKAISHAVGPAEAEEGTYTVYEYAEFGGGVKMPPVFEGPGQRS